MLFGSKATREAVVEEHGEETYILPTNKSLFIDTDSPVKAKTAKRDFSLDSTLDEDGQNSFVDMVRDRSHDPETELARRQTQELVQTRLAEVIDSLNDRERMLLDSRLLSDVPMTLQEIGDHFGVTRERARQLESSLKKKLAAVITHSNSDEESLFLV